MTDRAKGWHLMKPAPLIAPSAEIELKLALPASDPQDLAKQLARVPALARRKATREQLHNVYYDTPDQVLRRQGVALRVRRTGTPAKPQWLQTLKMGNSGDSALSQRGEWEVPLPEATLSRKALKMTPWSGIDPDGTVFKALSPCFATRFDRTLWRVRRRDGSVIEVALDVGEVVAGDKRAPLCELELELRAGSPAALFDLARQIAGTVAVLPSSMSKAQRGYALAQDTLGAPLSAHPPFLGLDMPVIQVAQRVLREMFNHFTANLALLRSSDDPEIVHQARVGWRRFRSALRLCRPVLAAEATPSWQALRPLLTFLGELRDLDVARTQTLAPWAEAYTAGDSRRAQTWDAMTQALTQAASQQRKSVRYALQDPAVGLTLLTMTEWLEGLPAATDPVAVRAKPKAALRQWARRRIDQLHARLKEACTNDGTPENQHRVRILAKRIRYGIEALQPLLTKHQSQRWYKQATNLQTSIGATRDVVQACALIAGLDADRGLIEFLRGVAAGRQGQP
jgi:inorganic triphosphatase YgiF